MGKVIGIDLGTTNTAVCVMNDGRPQMLQNEKGYSVFPSAVFIDERGKVLVGHKAKTSLLTKPHSGAYAVKRLLGLRFDAEQRAKIQKNVSYEITSTQNGNCGVKINDTVYSPTEIAGMILKEAKSFSERMLNETVDEAVITVPAHFNHAQRTATKEAAALVGLHCERIINEPTAAALAYGFRKDGDRLVLVYDLGGGTFDISILQFGVGVVETLATRGDTFLGGEDFDERLVNHLAEQFLAQHKVDVRDDPVAKRRLKDAAEKAKCELSFREKTEVYIPQIHGVTTLHQSLTRSEVESMCEDLVQRTIDIVKQTLQDANKRVSDIDEVILVGGQTRMPRVEQVISSFFSKKPSRAVNPDEAVAIGAAVHAGSLVGQAKAPILLDVTPYDLGIDISGGLFEKVILRNTKIPTSVDKRFNTARINQSTIRIVIRQGENRIAKDNEFLGEFTMSGLTSGTMGTASVEVNFRLDSNGILQVTAKEPTTGEKAKITVKNYGQFVKDSKKISLDVDSQSREIHRPDEEQVTSESSIPKPKISTPAIQKKAGFFNRLFGKKDAPQSDEVVPAPEVEQTTSDFEDSEEMSFDDEPMDLSDDILEVESPASIGMADSSSALQGRDLEKQSNDDEVFQLPEIEPDEDEVLSEILFEGIEEDKEDLYIEEQPEELELLDELLDELQEDLTDTVTTDGTPESVELVDDDVDLELDIDDLLDSAATAELQDLEETREHDIDFDSPESDEIADIDIDDLLNQIDERSEEVPKPREEPLIEPVSEEISRAELSAELEIDIEAEAVAEEQVIELTKNEIVQDTEEGSDDLDIEIDLDDFDDLLTEGELIDEEAPTTGASEEKDELEIDIEAEAVAEEQVIELTKNEIVQDTEEGSDDLDIEIDLDDFDDSPADQEAVSIELSKTASTEPESIVVEQPEDEDIALDVDLSWLDDVSESDEASTIEKTTSSEEEVQVSNSDTELQDDALEVELDMNPDASEEILAAEESLEGVDVDEAGDESTVADDKDEGAAESTSEADTETGELHVLDEFISHDESEKELFALPKDGFLSSLLAHFGAADEIEDEVVIQKSMPQPVKPVTENSIATDEELEIPSPSAEPEEDLDLDFLEDLFDD